MNGDCAFIRGYQEMSDLRCPSGPSSGFFVIFVDA